MTVKNWSTGEVLTAADMNAWAVPKAAYKTSGTARTSTTPVIDPDLQFTLAASAFYIIEAGIIYQASSGGTNLKFTFATTTGFGGGYTAILQSAGFGSTWGAVNAAGDNGAATVWAVRLAGMYSSGSGGTFGFSWSPQNAGTMTVGAGAYLIARRVG